MQVQLKITDLAAAALLAVFFWNPAWPTPGPDVPDVPAPSADLQALVKPVADALAGHPEQAERLSAFYLAFADVIERDAGKIVKTTGHVRTYNKRAIELGFGGDWATVGLADPVDAVLVARLGKEHVAMDAEKTATAVEALNALAWACGQVEK